MIKSMQKSLSMGLQGGFHWSDAFNVHYNSTVDSNRTLVKVLLRPDLRLHRAFENPLAKVALFFHRASVPLFTKFNKLLQSDEPAICIVHDCHKTSENSGELHYQS